MANTCMLILQPVVRPNLRKIILETLHKQTGYPVPTLAALVCDAHDSPPCLAASDLLRFFEEFGHHA